MGIVLTLVSPLLFVYTVPAVVPYEVPGKLTISPSMVSTTEGTSSVVELICAGISPWPGGHSVLWRRNNTVIALIELRSNVSRTSLLIDDKSNTVRLFIRSPMVADSATYRCEVQVNVSVVVQSPAALIKVTGSVKQGKSKPFYALVKGLESSVYCPGASDDSTTSRVLWSKNRRQLVRGVKYHYSNGERLSIRNVGYEDAGPYYCIRYTSLTTLGKTWQIEVIVQGLPAAPQNLSRVSQKQGGSCKQLTWKRPPSDGNSAITAYILTCTTYGRTHSLTQLCQENSTSLNLQEIQEGVLYLCKVQTVNALGRSNYSNVIEIYCEKRPETGTIPVNYLVTSNNQPSFFLSTSIPITTSEERFLYTETTSSVSSKAVTSHLVVYLSPAISAAVAMMVLYTIAVFVYFYRRRSKTVSNKDKCDSNGQNRTDYEVTAV